MLETRTVPEHKKQIVKDFADMMDTAEIIGIVNMENLPAKQLQVMRAQLREDVDMLMTKRRLIKLALKASKKPRIAELEKHIKGMPAILFSNKNPFALYSTLKKNKSKAPIKAGQTAPNDIIVPAGPTGFAPGPIIGELGSFGIKAGVEDGKIAIKEDSQVAKEGDEINDKLAGLLTRLGIEPMEIGLDLVAVYEKGEILTKDILDIDEEEYFNNLKLAASWALNLALESSHPTSQTLPLLLGKGHFDAIALATAQDVLTDETVKGVLAKANAHASALKAKVPDTPVEEVKEEPKAEEAKEEAPAEKPAEAEAEAAEAPAEEKVEEKAEEAAPVEEAKPETTEEKAEEPKEETKEAPKEETPEETKSDSQESKSEE